MAPLTQVIPLYAGDMILHKQWSPWKKSSIQASSQWKRRLLDVLLQFQKNLGSSLLSFSQQVIANINLSRVEFSHLVGNHFINEMSEAVHKSFPTDLNTKQKTKEIITDLYDKFGTESEYFPSHSPKPIFDQSSGKTKIRCKCINVMNASILLAINGDFMGFSPDVCSIHRRICQHFGRMCSDTFDEEMLQMLRTDQNEIIEQMESIHLLRDMFEKKSAIPLWRNLLHVTLKFLDCPFYLNGLRYERGNKEMIDLCLKYASYKTKGTVLLDTMNHIRLIKDFQARVDGYQDVKSPQREANYLGENILKQFDNKLIYNNNSLKCMLCYTFCYY